jgi:hypothetical protein
MASTAPLHYHLTHCFSISQVRFLCLSLSVFAAHVLFISMNWLVAMFMWKKQCKDKEVLLQHGWTARPPPRYSFSRNRENSINLTTSVSRPIKAFSVDIPSYPLLQPPKVEEESDSEVPQFHLLLHFLFSLGFWNVKWFVLEFLFFVPILLFLLESIQI